MKQNHFNQWTRQNLIHYPLFCLLFLLNSAAWGGLVENPGFETATDIAPWFVFGGSADLSVDRENQHSGSYSLRVENRQDNYVGPAQDLLGKLETGVNYTISAWVKLKTAQEAPPYFKLNIKREDNRGKQYIEVDRMLIQHTGWIKLSGPFQLDSQDNLKALSLYISNEDASIDFYVDDIAIEAPPAYVPTTATATDIVRVQGRDLVIGKSAQKIQLLGINFTAYSDDLKDSADVVFKSKNYEEIDYQRVADMGMNVVRLNMYYKVFEDDDKPFQYKQEGWEWLEKNIVWARKYGLGLILDMHAPQGGYQSWGYNGPFWKKTSYQQRLTALWVAIAARYRLEPTIVAYDLINEPAPKKMAQWQSYATQLIAAIREVDPYHAMIIEESFSDDGEPFVLDDNNLIYDFHLYETWAYVNQLLYHQGRGDGGTYPDPGISAFPYHSRQQDGDWVGNASIPTGNSDWTYYEGQLHPISSERIFAATPVFISEKNSGKAYFDEFVVHEYDSDKRYVRQVIHAEIEPKPFDWYFLTSLNPFLSYAEEWKSRKLSGSGKRSVETEARVGEKSIAISNASGVYLLRNEKMMFPVKNGHFYQISGWMKGEKIQGQGAKLGFEFKVLKDGVERSPFTKQHLEETLLNAGLSFYREHNVPVNVGEFGISVNAFTAERGGIRQLNDWLDLFQQYGVHAQYYRYHGVNYGLHSNVIGFPTKETGNQDVIDFLTQKLSGQEPVILPAPPAGSLPAPSGAPENTPQIPGQDILSTEPEDLIPTPPDTEPAERNVSDATPIFSETCMAAYTSHANGATLSIPCVAVAEQVYQVVLQESFSPFIFLLDLLQINDVTASISNTDPCLGRYFADSSLYLPCVRQSNTQLIWEAYFAHLIPSALFWINLEQLTLR